MASNKNNNALWKNIREIKKQAQIYYHWVDLLSCEIWECKKNKDGKNQPILNENGKLPESRIEKLEEKLEEILESSDSDTDSEDSLDGEIARQLEEIQKLKDEIIQLNDRTVQGIAMLTQLGTDNQEQLNIHGGEIADLEARADVLETDRDSLRGRIHLLEHRRGLEPGAGGGKRRKRKTRKKRRKKKTKKRRKKRNRKKRTKRRK